MKSRPGSWPTSWRWRAIRLSDVRVLENPANIRMVMKDGAIHSGAGCYCMNSPRASMMLISAYSVPV